MKKTLLLLFAGLTLFTVNAQTNLKLNFKALYNQYPGIPKGMLEAIAMSKSRMQFIVPDPQQESCIGIPETYGYFALTLNGKNYFRNNLLKISQISGISVSSIISNPDLHLQAYAKAYHQIQSNLGIDNKAENQLPVLIELSEIPLDQNPVNQFALLSQAYDIYSFLNNVQFQEEFELPSYTIDLKLIFGVNAEILSGKKVIAGTKSIKDEQNNQWKLLPLSQPLSPDYGPALWNPAASCNYSSRNGTAISAVTIHTVQGSYAGCISWFQNCSASVSAHYVIRSSDGQVTQMVLESNKAWHVGSENPYTIGIEHEGYISQASWYTSAMYNSSAALVRDICNSGYGINPLRAYHGSSCSGICTLGGCVKIKGHQHYPNNTHTDPGPNWDWYLFYTLINNNPSITTLTASTGTFYDSGGPSNNYNNDERTVVLIQPTGATNVTLQFTQFNLEANWDYMYIYDGNSVNSPLIGRFTGTASPGTVTSSGGALLIDFRSDCATTNPGWAATYTANIATPTGPDVTPPVTQVISNGNWKTQNFPAAFVDSDNAGGSGVEKGYYQVIDYDGIDWGANVTRGFFADNFDLAISPLWTQKTGSWSISNQSLFQSVDTLSNTNIYAPLTQNLSNRYLYHFTMMINGSGANRRAGFHFFCNQPDSVNRGDGYFVWFRVDQSKLQIYKVINNNFGSPVLDVPMTVTAGTWYDYKVIYDRISGIMRVYQNNILVGAYTDSSPYTNGNFISFRSGNATMYVNELKIYRSRAASANITLNATSADIRYQNPAPSINAAKIKSICSDSALNLSAIDYHNLNIDWTNPDNIDTVRDGLANDIAITNSINTLSANWNSSFDQHSGIANYYYCVGTTPGDSNVVAWTANMASTTATITGLNLQQGQMYYFTVMAENGAGLKSQKISSNGQLVDTNAVVSVNTIALSESPYWNIFPNPGTTSSEILILLHQNSEIELKISDVTGRLIADKKLLLPSGKNLIGLNEFGKQLLPGTYLVEFYLHQQKLHKKLIIQ